MDFLGRRLPAGTRCDFVSTALLYFAPATFCLGEKKPEIKRFFRGRSRRIGERNRRIGASCKLRNPSRTKCSRPSRLLTFVHIQYRSSSRSDDEICTKNGKTTFRQRRRDLPRRTKIPVPNFDKHSLASSPWKVKIIINYLSEHI